METDNHRDKLIEEAGYAVINRANGIRENGDVDFASELRVFGLKLIEESREEEMDDIKSRLTDETLFIEDK